MAQPNAKPTGTVLSMVGTLTLALVLAGCVGPDPADPIGPDDNETDPPPSGTDDRNEQAPEWSYDRRSGNTSGVNATAASVGGSEEPFSVDPSVSLFFVNVTADDDVTVCIRAPDAGESSSFNETECEASGSTQNGNGSWEVTSPDSGEWVVELTPDALGPAEVSYEMEIAQLEDAGDDNATIV